MIKLDSVSFWYGLKAPVLKNFSLTIRDGERVCLSGSSGIGKTTVLRLAMGLEKPRHGTVTVPEGLRISAVFQENRLIPWKTVYENVALFAEIPAAESSPAGTKDAVLRLLRDLGLKSAAGRLPAELSGGMKRRAALARALAHPSGLLVLDEAFTGLDDTTKQLCLAVTNREAAGRMVLLAAHDLTEAAALGARIVTLA